MKTQFIRLLAVLTVFAAAQCAFAQGTAFTYQGQLFDNTNPANGNYALKFTLYSDATSGMPALAGPVILAPVAVSNGLFTVLLDFGSNPNPFTGPARWLQIDSASNSASPIFIPMNPRQQLTPAPYAIFAATASNLSGTLPTGQLSGTVLNSQLANNGITINAGVGLSGGGTVPLGSTATLNNTGVLSVIGNADITANTATGGSIILGDTATSANTPGTIVKRDGTGSFAGNLTGNATTAGTASSVVSGAIAAAQLNTTSQPGTGQLLGYNGSGLFWTNPAKAWNLTGNAGTSPSNGNFLGTTDAEPLEFWANSARVLRLEPGDNFLTQPNLIGGSSANVVDPGVSGATIAGGGTLTFLVNQPNRISANFSFIGGGQGNGVQSNAFFSAIAGGDQNGIQPASDHAFIGGGFQNDILSNSPSSSVGGGQFNRVSGTAATVGGGFSNFVGSFYGTIAGGYDNSASNPEANAPAVGGGAFNTASGSYATVSGGKTNTANNDFSTVSGGYGNTASGLYAMVSGGYGNVASGLASFVGGGGAASNGIKHANFAIGESTAVVGGVGNIASGYECFVGGGYSNTVSGGSSTIGGGDENIIGNAVSATVAGGSFNAAYGNSPTVGGGFGNLASNGFAVVGGGGLNVASGAISTVPGGTYNTASGYNSFAAGYSAVAAHTGAFVWSDCWGTQLATNSFGLYGGPFFYSATSNEFAVRATGGVRFVTAVDGNGNPTAGVKLSSGGTSWATISDRNAKKNFARVDCEAVLAKLAEVPVQRWNYKWEADDSVPHLGPMAQDFKAAFYPGRDDKSISTLEFDGVELAAIQGLNQKLEERDQKLEAYVKAKDAEIQQLKQSVAELKEMVSQLAKTKSK